MIYILKMKNILTFSIILVFSTTLSAANVPNLPKCKKSDPDLDNCLINGIQVALDLLSSKGIPELKIPNADPLEVPEIVLDTDGTSLQITQKYTNVKLYGHRGAKIKSAHMDFDKKILTFSVFVPLFSQEAAYDLNGKFLVLPVHGNGKSVITLVNSTVLHTLMFEEKKSGKETYYNVKTHYVNLTTNGAKFEFDNLFDGNKQVSDSFLKTVNDNWKLVFDDVKAGLEIGYGEVYQSMSRRFFSAVPITQIFLE